MRIPVNAIAASALALGIAIPVLSALAQSVTAGSIEIVQPWARATPPAAKVGGGYMTITNHGTESDTLMGGSSPVAGEVQVHEMSVQDGIMKMRELGDGLEIKPGETVELKPGGYHLMLMNLSEPLRQGEHVSATLDFAKAGKVEIVLGVAGIGAKSPEGMAGMDMDEDDTGMSDMHMDRGETKTEH